MATRLPTDVIRDRLAVYLGPNTARNAIKTFSERSLGMSPEQVTGPQVAKLLEALRPMLRTLVGTAKADKIVSQLVVELDLRS